MEDAMREPLMALTRNGGDVDYAAYDDDSKRIVREVGVRNMFIRSRLHKLLAAYGREGIGATVLKGAHLIHDIYPFGIRPIEDIDLLVDRSDFDRLDRLMRSLGYTDNAVGIDVWTHLMVSNKITYFNDSHPVIPVDIHFSLGPYPYLGRIGPELLAAHSRRLETEDGPLTVLGPELLLLHLCLHLFQHHFDHWHVSGFDITAVIRQYPALDWHAFTGLIRKLRLQLPVAYSLRKASELSGMDIPAAAMLKGDAVSRRERWIFASSAKQRSDFDRYYLQFLTTPGLGVKLRCAARIVSPGRSFLRHYYGGSYGKYIRHMTKTAVKSSTAVPSRH